MAIPGKTTTACWERELAFVSGDEHILAQNHAIKHGWGWFPRNRIPETRETHAIPESEFWNNGEKESWRRAGGKWRQERLHIAVQNSDTSSVFTSLGMWGGGGASKAKIFALNSGESCNEENPRGGEFFRRRHSNTTIVKLRRRSARRKTVTAPECWGTYVKQRDQLVYIRWWGEESLPDFQEFFLQLLLRARHLEQLRDPPPPCPCHLPPRFTHSMRPKNPSRIEGSQRAAGNARRDEENRTRAPPRRNPPEDQAAVSPEQGRGKQTRVSENLTPQSLALALALPLRSKSSRAPHGSRRDSRKPARETDETRKLPQIPKLVRVAYIYI